MYARKRFLAIAGALLLVSCGGLPRALRNQIASEKTGLQQADRQLQHSLETVRADLAHSPSLFQGTPVSTEWPARLQSARGTLDRARNDLQQLDKISDPRRAEQLLGEERGLRQSVIHEAESVEADANSWLDFERNVPHYLAAMQNEYDEIHAVDLTPVAAVVQKAEQDWPAKKSSPRWTARRIAAIIGRRRNAVERDSIRQTIRDGWQRDRATDRRIDSSE